ncbi:Cytochrome c oxidase polypeptide I / Cytochrome c oxidase polypeptide III [Roseibacterium elongatum DSM 19469]|uniref:cytochrome-c oxidase n=1 Tax=Roseicyclus elongatus DSM 19469 TaxID=1294273 RepID=W8S4G4_9RHOB|nr:cytochrome c oxidase subunit I [Roseibacterium elongatum]AHM05092.1 Cytochrome c oxidase polypeptide I / Cytochrome c oxidase polypeptide III [Roseibacterium elongatum DSM 19469]
MTDIPHDTGRDSDVVPQPEAQEPAYDRAPKGAQGKDFEAIWAQPPGWRVISSVSHRVVGKRFLITGFIFFLIAGVFALLVRLQLLVPENTFLDSETYNQLFTMHGTIMMFLFAIPMLEGFAVYLIPLMIGARDLVFPRLGAFGYWCYLFGGIIVLSSFLFDAAPAGGWFMYVPLSTSAYTEGLSADFWLIGITLAEIASVTAAVEIIAAILCSRAPGMTLTRMPILMWYFLAAAFMIAVAFPPLIIGSILLEAERLLNLPFFDVALGGDPLLWQHLFWLFGHPEVYIIFLPAAGMVATMLPVFVGKPLFGYGFAVAAIVTMAFLSFGLWAHHMFATGLPEMSLTLFSAASTMVAVPTGVQIFCFIATLTLGKPRLTVPMLFILGFLFIFVLGGLTGVMLAAVPFNLQAHDSYFVVAHLHYVLIGGFVFPMFGALYYWVPHFTGRMMSETLGRWVFWLMFAGFNLAFFMMHLTGMRGMPRRVATYPADIGWDRLNMLSTVGAFILAAGIAVFIWDFFRHQRVGKPAGRNPWGAATLEWLYAPAPPGYNFRAIPRVTSREPLWDQPELTERPAAEVDGALRRYPDHRRETLGCDPISGEPIQILRLPHPTWFPLLSATGLAILFAATLAGVYWLCGVGALIALVGITGWVWEPSDSGVARDIGLEGLRLPVNAVDKRSHLHVGLIGTNLILSALYASLLFAGLYLWNTQPVSAEQTQRPERIFALMSLGLGVIAFALSWMTGRAAARAQLWMSGALNLLLATILGALAYTMARALLPVDPWSTAFAAVGWAMGAFLAAVFGVALYWALFNALRKAVGAVHPSQGLPDLLLGSYGKVVSVMALVTAGAFLVAGTPQ